MCIAIKYEIERTKTVLIEICKCTVVGASMNRENENKAIEICKCTVLALVEKQEKTSQNGRAVNQNMFQQPKQTQKLIKNNLTCNTITTFVSVSIHWVGHTVECFLSFV